MIPDATLRAAGFQDAELPLARLFFENYTLIDNPKGEPQWQKISVSN